MDEMMPLRLLPTNQFEHGMAREYCVVLPNRDTAILTLVPAKGWQLTIQTPAAASIDRGLFSTTYDALCVLRAEYGTPIEPRVPLPA